MDTSSTTPGPSTALVNARLQIVVDCADPHAVADFWAAALGYEVHQDGAFVRQMLDAGHAAPDDVIERNGVLVWKTAAAMNDPSAGRSRWYFQAVEEPKQVKNRLHIDLHVGEDRRQEAIDHLLSLGATQLYVGQQGPQTWVTMADIEGNEFCVS